MIQLMLTSAISILPSEFLSKLAMNSFIFSLKAACEGSLEHNHTSKGHIIHIIMVLIYAYMKERTQTNPALIFLLINNSKSVLYKMEGRIDKNVSGQHNEGTLLTSTWSQNVNN